ncbi:MAG: hypothetical protein OXU81_07490 [Gammaproteobacteria bacterium]|nr:hypothetical protein [Gammaproteobacteria bacterium]
MLILDKPTSVLTPDEADEILGLMREMADDMRISVVLITHKLREVEAYARTVSVLRHGRLVGLGAVGELSHSDLVWMMIGRERIPAPASRIERRAAPAVLEVRGLRVNNDKGITAVSEDLDEILVLADRIAVTFEGRFVCDTPREEADVHEIGRHMASHV